MIFFTSTCRKIIDSCDKYVLHTVVETLQYASPPVVASSLVQGGGGGWPGYKATPIVFIIIMKTTGGDACNRKQGLTA